MTWDARYLEPIRTLTANLDFDVVTCRSGEPKPSSAWQLALYLRSLARLIHVMNDTGLPSDTLVTSYLKYIRALHRYCTDRGGWHEGSASYLASEVMMQAAGITQDPAERAQFIEAGKAAFHAYDDTIKPDGTGQFWTSKNTTFLLLGGGRYEIHASEQGLEPAE